MKTKFILLLFSLINLFLLQYCNQNEEKEQIGPVCDCTGGILISNNISKNRTLVNDSIYVLAGQIIVEPNVTLTIEPGTIVKGEVGTGNNASILIISRGAKIMAEGTPEAPIIFTSTADVISPQDIASGNFASPNLSADIDGLWGGLYILGDAKISSSNANLDSDKIDNLLPFTDTDITYGGDNDLDNSGVLSYVSIRHGASSIGHEIPHFVLAGVGSSTTIHNIEVVASQDDGLDIYGGTVAIENVVVWNCSDDGIDTDQSFAGSVDNFIIINPGNKALELDGPEGSYQGGGHTISNGYVYLSDASGGYDDDENTDAIVSDIYFTGYNEETDSINDYNENGNFLASNLQMDNSYIANNGNQIMISVEEYFSEMAGKTDDNGNPIIITVDPGTQTVGPTTITGFEWTWAYQAGMLAEIGLN